MTKQMDIMAYSIKLLNNKIYFINELYKKLIIKYDRSEVCSVIKELIKKDYINDKKASLIYLNNLINYKMYGRKYIYSFFEKKNISRKLIDYLMLNFSDDVFYSSMKKIINELTSKGKSNRYINNYLRRKGYDIEEL